MGDRPDRKLRCSRAIAPEPTTAARNGDSGRLVVGAIQTSVTIRPGAVGPLGKSADGSAPKALDEQEDRYPCPMWLPAQPLTTHRRTPMSTQPLRLATILDRHRVAMAVL